MKGASKGGVVAGGLFLGVFWGWGGGGGGSSRAGHCPPKNLLLGFPFSLPRPVCRWVAFEFHYTVNVVTTYVTSKPSPYPSKSLTPPPPPCTPKQIFHDEKEHINITIMVCFLLGGDEE